MRSRFAAATADRLDKVIADQTSLSRKRARTLIQRGGVRVDGMARNFPGYEVTQGALVELRTGAAPRKARVGEALEERWRGGGVVVVDKPSGLPSQPVRDGKSQHVYGMVASKEGYAGLHHRLDLPASGLMLLSIAPEVNPRVAGWFREGKITRLYRIVVVGDPGESGVWNTAIDDLHARSQWVREATVDGMTALWVQIDTGRTHQIRRHAEDAGFPIVGDRRHGGAAGRLWPRLALHAAVLQFPHPKSSDEVTVRSPLPDDLHEIFQRAGVEALGIDGPLPTFAP